MTLLIDLSFPTLGNLIQKFQNLSNPHHLLTLPPTGFTLIGAYKFSKKSTLAFLINMVNHAVQREKRKYLITLGHTPL